MVTLKKITKEYVVADYNKVEALKEVSIDFPATGLVIINGKSGSGKTTLLNLLGGLDDVTAGEITIGETNISEFSEQAWDDFRNINMGIVYQEYNLIENLNVYQNVMFPLELQQWRGKSKEQCNEMVRSMLTYVELEEYENRKIGQLSGGQRQRVAIARALIKNPRMILADEPTGNLDEKTGQHIFDLLKRISKQCLVIVVTHDEHLARKYADRILTIYDGAVAVDQDNAASGEYQITVKNEKQESVTFQIQNQEDLQKFAQALVENASEQEVGFEVKVKTREKPGSHKSNGNVLKQETFSEHRKEIIQKKLTAKMILQFACLSFRKRKWRLFFTLVVFSITIFLLLLTTTFYTYDKNISMTQYLKKYDVKYLEPYEPHTYHDLFEQEQDANVFVGALLYEKVSKMVGEKNIVGVKEETLVVAGEESVDEINTMFIGEQDLPYEINGRYPAKSQEVVITDYLADILQLDEECIGERIQVNGEKKKIVGILQTDYKEYQIIEKEKKELLEDYGRYRLAYDYKIIFLSKQCQTEEKEKKQVLYLPASNFIYGNVEVKYVNSLFSYGSMASYNDIALELLSGRLPENKNEVIISEETVYNYTNYHDVKKIVGEQFDYLDLKTERYGDSFSSILNLKEYFPDGVTVVGVFTDLNNIEEDYYVPRVFLDDSQFEKISSDYYSYYNYDAYRAYFSKNSYHHVLEKAQEFGVLFNEPVLNDINDFAVFLQDYKVIIFLGMLIFIVLTFFMIITFIGFAIGDNAKTIGILRSLGVVKKDTLKIFALEALLLSLAASLAAIILSQEVLDWFNGLLMQGVEEQKFSYCYMKITSIIGVSMFTVLMSLLAAIVPIWSFAKKKPIDIIREI